MSLFNSEQPTIKFEDVYKIGFIFKGSSYYDLLPVCRWVNTQAHQIMKEPITKDLTWAVRKLITRYFGSTPRDIEDVTAKFFEDGNDRNIWIYYKGRVIRNIILVEKDAWGC